MSDLLTTECPCIVKNLALSKEKVWLLCLASGKHSSDPWNVIPARGISNCLKAFSHTEASNTVIQGGG